MFGDHRGRRMRATYPPRVAPAVVKCCNSGKRHRTSSKSRSLHVFGTPRRRKLKSQHAIDAERHTGLNRRNTMAAIGAPRLPNQLARHVFVPRGYRHHPATPQTPPGFRPGRVLKPLGLSARWTIRPSRDIGGDLVRGPAHHKAAAPALIAAIEIVGGDLGSGADHLAAIEHTTGIIVCQSRRPPSGPLDHRHNWRDQPCRLG